MSAVWTFPCIGVTSRTQGIFVGEIFSEKDFDDRNTRGDSVGDARFARTIGAATGDARHQFEKCDEYSPCTASP